MLRVILLGTAAMAAMAGCRASVMRVGHRTHGRELCVLELAVTDWDARPLRGRWEAPRDLLEQIGDAEDGLPVQIRLQIGPSHWRGFTVAPRTAWETTDQGFGLSAAVGTATFTVGDDQGGPASGEFTLTAADRAGRWEGITGEPDGPSLLALTLRAVDDAYIEALAEPDAPLTWAQVERLHSHGVSPAYVRAIRQARSTPATRPAPVEAAPLGEPGPLPAFTVDDIVYLAGRGITAEYVQGLQAAGYRLDARQLYYLNSRGIGVSWAAAWRQAGYDLSPEDLYYAQSRGIDVAYATAMREAGQPSDLKTLYYLSTRGISSQFARQFRDLGYALKPEELYYLSTRGITPEYAASMNDSDHELLSPQQLYHLQSHGVDPDLVRALRGQGPR